MIPKHVEDETIQLLAKYEMKKGPFKGMFNDIVFDENKRLPNYIIAIAIERLDSVWLRKNMKLTNEKIHNVKP